MDNINLTPKQKKVIKDLQNGGMLLTDRSYYGAYVYSPENKDYRINVVFYFLIDNGIIYQQLSYPFDYVLTKLGHSIKL